MDTNIDRQVRLVPLVPLQTDKINMNIKTDMDRDTDMDMDQWANGKRIKEHHLDFRFPFETAACII